MTYTTAPLRSWREEAREDRRLKAEIDRDRETTRYQARIADREAAARLRREDGYARRAAKDARAARRAARVTTALEWCRDHAVDLLFVPVIAIPAELAWTAMAAYGYGLYGTAGLGLPAVSEGSMWAFAAATTLTRRRHPDRPVWHLRLGTLIFALTGAAMNFAHGYSHGGPVTGALMAMVSDSGVTAHQLVTAGPRRSSEARHRDRLARAAARREARARRAAVRRAVVDLDEDGNARLVYEPGTAALKRRLGLGPARLAEPAAAAVVIRTEPANGDPEQTRTDEDRTGEVRTDDRTAEVPPPPPPPAADKDAVVADLVADILAAAAAGETWKPDYEDMQARTGFGLSWCEKRVREARRSVFTAPARTGANPDGTGNPDGQARTNRTAARTGVPDGEPAGAVS